VVFSYGAYVRDGVQVVSVDIQTMAKMPIDEYRRYVRDHLVHVDHHDILRSAAAGYPLATNKAQVQELIDHLKELRHKVAD
jgi:hypothetical protein